MEIERNGEIIPLKAGLRKVEISNKYELLINGVSVKLHGVNRHDTSKYNGWYQTDKELAKDLQIIQPSLEEIMVHIERQDSKLF